MFYAGVQIGKWKDKRPVHYIIIHYEDKIVHVNGQVHEYMYVC